MFPWKAFALPDNQAVKPNTPQKGPLMRAEGSPQGASAREIAVTARPRSRRITAPLLAFLIPIAACWMRLTGVGQLQRPSTPSFV
jgi:hypothetical protein